MFLDLTPKLQATKAKINNWDYQFKKTLHGKGNYEMFIMFVTYQQNICHILFSFFFLPCQNLFGSIRVREGEVNKSINQLGN